MRLLAIVGAMSLSLFVPAAFAADGTTSTAAGNQQTTREQLRQRAQKERPTPALPEDVVKMIQEARKAAAEFKAAQIEAAKQIRQATAEERGKLREALALRREAFREAQKARQEAIEARLKEIKEEFRARRHAAAEAAAGEARKGRKP